MTKVMASSTHACTKVEVLFFTPHPEKSRGRAGFHGSWQRGARISHLYGRVPSDLVLP